MKILFATFLTCFASASWAAPGEVKQIDMANLREFGSLVPTDCESHGDSVGYTVWTYLNYKDGDTTRRLAVSKSDTESTYTSNGTCAAVKGIVMTQINDLNTDLNDISQGNVGVNDSGVCLGKYLVATLSDAITLPDGSKADLATVQVSKRVVRCP
jgi:hypothetical protein